MMTSFVPNDFDITRQWYLDASPIGIGVTEAWKCFHGQENGPVIAVGKLLIYNVVGKIDNKTIFIFRQSEMQGRAGLLQCCVVTYQVIDSGCSAHPDLLGKKYNHMTLLF